MVGATETQSASDAIAYAAQIGRLDLITAMLAAIAVILALGGVFAFFDVRRAARSAARSTAAEESSAIAEKAAISYLEKALPSLISEYTELARNAARDDQANAIAEAQEDGADNANEPQ